MMRWLLLLIVFPLLSHAAVERLVTLGGDVTEIVYALGAEQSLVARDSTSTWPVAAQKLPDVGYLRQQIAAIPTRPAAKRVLFILSHGGMNTLVAGQHTAADGAIRAAGLQNAMQGFDHYRAMSQEGVAASQADLVVISADGLKGMGGEAGLWKLPGLAQTPAGRHKQLLTIDDMALLGFGPRTPQAIIALRNKAEQLP